MYLNFVCVGCESEIQSEYQNIGDWVGCPVCEMMQIVPDPVLAVNSEYFGHKIVQLVSSSFIWNVYIVARPDKNEDKEFIMCVPSTFILKNSSDIDSIYDTVIRNGIFNLEQFPTLVDKSLVPGKTYFLFDYSSEMVGLRNYVKNRAKVDYQHMMILVKNLAEALKSLWDKEHFTYKNLNPDVIRISSHLDVRILYAGFAEAVNDDPGLIENNLSLWNYSYTSPEIFTGTSDDSQAHDIYTIGTVLFYLCTGEDPFNGMEPPQIMNASIPNPTFINESIPSEIVTLINDCMNLNSPSRIRDWVAFMLRVSEILDSEGETETVIAKSLVDERKKTMKLARLNKHNSPMGITHKNILKDSRKIKKLKRKPKPTETIARKIHIKESITALREKSVKRKRNAILRLVAFIMILIIGLVYTIYYIANREPLKISNTNIADKTTPTNGDEVDISDQTVGDEGPKVETTSLKNTPKPKGLRGDIFEIEKFYMENPDSFDETLLKFNKLSDKILEKREFKLFDELRNKISDIEDKRDKRVNQILVELKKETVKMIDEDKYSEAIDMLTNYKGKLQVETELGRKNLTREVVVMELNSIIKENISVGKFDESQKLLGDYIKTYPAYKMKFETMEQEVVKMRNKATEQLSFVVKNIALNVLNLKTENAKEKLRTAMLESKYIQIRELIKDMLYNLNEYDTIDRIILKHYSALRGKKVNVSLIDKGEISMVVKLIKGRKVFGILPVKKVISFTPDMLEFDNVMDILRSVDLGLRNNSLLKAMLCIKSGQHQKSADYFKSMPLRSGKVFVSYLNEVAAKTEFSNILAEYKMPFEAGKPEVLVRYIIETKKLKLKDADSLFMSLMKWYKNYETTGYVKTVEREFQELKKFCRSSGTKVATELEISPSLLSDIGKSLVQVIAEAEPYTSIILKSGTYNFAKRKNMILRKPGISLIGSPGVVLDTNITIGADDISIENIGFKNCKFDVLGSDNLRLNNVVTDGSVAEMMNSKNVIFDNCFFRGIKLTGVESVQFRHCTILSNPKSKLLTAMFIDDSGVEITDSLMYGDDYGFVIEKNRSRRKVSIDTSVCFGIKAIGANVDKKGSVITRSLANKGARVRTLAKVGVNLYKTPVFEDKNSNNYRLMSKLPGYKQASDKTDCGINWNKIKYELDSLF